MSSGDKQFSATFTHLCYSNRRVENQIWLPLDQTFRNPISSTGLDLCCNKITRPMQRGLFLPGSVTKSIVVSHCSANLLQDLQSAVTVTAGTNQNIHTFSLVVLGNLCCKSHICSTCRMVHCLYQMLPTWFSKLPHIVVSF